MGIIKYIALHHSGSLKSNRYASTVKITPEQISNAHKNRWDFPSKYIKRENGEFWYGGYNVFYSPITRKITQFRAIGEETAAQRYYNSNTFSLCIGGNYLKRRDGLFVDNMTRQTEEDVASFLDDLIKGNKRNLVVAPNTTLDFSINRVNPHRFYQRGTECNGSFPDSWGRDLLLKNTNQLDYSQLQVNLTRLQTMLNAILLTLRSKKLGGVEHQECILPDNILL